MLTCIAIDDEPLALELVEDNISKLPYLKLVGSYTNPIEAVALLQKEKIDLVFLDIQMPGLTGMQVIQSLTTKPMFIFITAYDRYALESYNLDVVDYLVKPMSLERFIKACNKAWAIYNLRNNKAENVSQPEYFFINADYSLLKVVFADIIYIEGLKDYVKIHLKSATNPLVARMSFKSLEEELPPSLFLRIHKSYIISKQYVTAIKKNSVFVNGLELPVGDLYKSVLSDLTGRKP